MKTWGFAFLAVWITTAVTVHAFEDLLLGFAEREATALREGRGLPQFSAEFPDATAVHAERVQKHFVTRRLSDGETLAGIKGAVVSAGGQQMFGLDGPLSAVLFKSGWHDASDEPLKIPVRDGAVPGVETELGILLSQPIHEAVPDIDALKACVKAVVPVIELPAGKHDWPQKPKDTDLIACNVDAAHYIVGKPHADPNLDLDTLPVRLLEDGEVRNETTGGDAKNGQWWNFLQQVNWAVRQGYKLEPGMLVITGALGTIHKAEAGRFRADFGPLGLIEFELTTGP